MPRIGALWLSFSKHTASRESLRKPREGQNVSGNACRSSARAVSSILAFAAFLQTPKNSSRHLQHSCKHQKILRGTCSIPANTKKFFGAFAAFLQTPKSFSGHLQHSCKRQKVFRGICSIPANAKKFFGALAALLQTFPKTLWPLERSIKDMLQGQQTSFFRRTRVAYRMGAVVRQEYPTCPKVFLSKKGRRLVRAS